MDFNHDSDSDSDFEFADDVFEKMRIDTESVPMKRLVQLRDYFNTQLELMAASKVEKALHYHQYAQRYFKITDEIDELELRLEKLKEVEKLTHYATELDELFLSLYPLRKDPEKFKEMQFVVSQRKIMKIFQTNYDTFMTTIRSLKDEAERKSRKAAKWFSLCTCCVPSEERAEMLGRTWEEEDVERRLEMTNLLIGLWL